MIAEAKRGFDDTDQFECECKLLWRNCNELLLAGGQAAVDKVEALLKEQQCFESTYAGFEATKNCFAHVTCNAGADTAKFAHGEELYAHCLQLLEQAEKRLHTFSLGDLEAFRATCYQSFKKLLKWFLAQGRGLIYTDFHLQTVVVALPRSKLVVCPMQQEDFLSSQTSLSIGKISVYQVRAYLYLLVAPLIKRTKHASSSISSISSTARLCISSISSMQEDVGHAQEEDGDENVECVLLGCVIPDIQGMHNAPRTTRAPVVIISAEMFNTTTWQVGDEKYHMNAALHKLLQWPWQQVGDMVYQRFDYLRFQRHITNADGVYSTQDLVLPLGVFNGLMPRGQGKKGNKPPYVNAHRQIKVSWLMLEYITKPGFNVTKWNVLKWIMDKDKHGCKPRHDLFMKNFNNSKTQLASFVDLMELLKEFLMQ